MRVWYCCLRRRMDTCTCSGETCRRCLRCITHCSCLVAPLRPVADRHRPVDAWAELDDPSGPFADLADVPFRVPAEF